MRASFFGALCCTIVLAPTAAGAGDFEYGPNASVYLSYAFDAPADQAADSGLRYGLRLDHDWRRRDDREPPALMEWQFDPAGFDHVALSGTPVVTSEMILRQDDGGGIGSFLANNFGRIVLFGGGALLVYAIVDASSSENDRDTDDVRPAPGEGDGPNCDAEPLPEECQGP